MLRFLSLACVVALAGSTAFAAQDRPNYSGSWSLVEDRSTPLATPRSLGTKFKIDQSATTVTIEHTAFRPGPMTLINGQPAGAVVRTEEVVSTVYTADGAEHEVPPTMPSQVNPNARVMVVASGSYRATWTTGQLIILNYGKVNSPSGGSDLSSIRRMSLSLDADGYLIVDSVIVRTRPQPNGPKEEPPVVVRSVYKKAQ